MSTIYTCEDCGLQAKVVGGPAKLEVVHCPRCGGPAGVDTEGIQAGEEFVEIELNEAGEVTQQLQGLLDEDGTTADMRLKQTGRQPAVSLAPLLNYTTRRETTRRVSRDSLLSLAQPPAGPAVPPVESKVDVAWSAPHPTGRRRFSSLEMGPRNPGYDADHERQVASSTHNQATRPLNARIIAEVAGVLPTSGPSPRSSGPGPLSPHAPAPPAPPGAPPPPQLSQRSSASVAAPISVGPALGPHPDRVAAALRNGGVARWSDQDAVTIESRRDTLEQRRPRRAGPVIDDLRIAEHLERQGALGAERHVSSPMGEDPSGGSYPPSWTPSNPSASNNQNKVWTANDVYQRLVDSGIDPTEGDSGKVDVGGLTGPMQGIRSNPHRRVILAGSAHDQSGRRFDELQTMRGSRRAPSASHVAIPPPPREHSSGILVVLFLVLALAAIGAVVGLLVSEEPATGGRGVSVSTAVWLPAASGEQADGTRRASEFQLPALDPQAPIRLSYTFEELTYPDAVTIRLRIENRSTHDIVSLRLRPSWFLVHDVVGVAHADSVVFSRLLSLRSPLEPGQIVTVLVGVDSDFPPPGARRESFIWIAVMAADEQDIFFDGGVAVIEVPATLH